MAAFFAGLDWGNQNHAVCVLDAQGIVCAKFDVSHNGDGLADLRHKLAPYAGDGLPIAIERPSGLIVDVLVEAGYQVVPIHPNVVKATRPRYRSQGAKSDAWDAYLLADLLRTDGHRFKTLAPLSSEIRALRALVRSREDLVATRVRLANQLRSVLESFWPGPIKLFCDLDSAISLAFLERYPTPSSAQRLGLKRMQAFCTRQGYSGRRSAEELLTRLHEAATVQCSQIEMHSNGQIVQALVRTLVSLVQQIQHLTRQIEHDVALLDDGQLFMSFPRAGRVCAAKILAEVGSDRNRFDSDERLAAEAGISPVTRQSGKSRAVGFRWACNHRLRAALTCLADNSRADSAWAAQIYGKARARGCSHPHAVRILARAWVRVIWRAWTNHQPYRPEAHRGAAELAVAGIGG